jgi:SAM-dependent methyltransferase
MSSALSFEDKYLSGKELYGDDLPLAEIEKWYKDEDRGYYDLYAPAMAADYSYGYAYLNHLHAFKFLKDRTFECCLALGCSQGADVLPLAKNVRRFVAVEPAEEWWSDNIGGTPATYMRPTVQGDIPLPSGSVDLVTAFSVLHHIPNASYVLSEIGRVVQSGGIFVLREPIHSLGDWRRPRRGLTRNERGFPLAWLDAQLETAGFRVIRRRFCMFPLSPRIATLLRMEAAYNHRWLTACDWAISWMTSWNLHYHRDSFFKKLAPHSAFYLLERV